MSRHSKDTTGKPSGRRKRMNQPGTQHQDRDQPLRKINEEHRKTGLWWNRTLVNTFYGPASLK